jgi:hypothetical protein
LLPLLLFALNGTPAALFFNRYLIGLNKMLGDLSELNIVRVGSPYLHNPIAQGKHIHLKSRLVPWKVDYMLNPHFFA